METQENKATINKSKNKWFAGYIVAGTILALAQSFSKTILSELIILVIAIGAGFAYRRLKSKIKIKNEVGKIILTSGILYIAAALLIGFLTVLVNQWTQVSLNNIQDKCAKQAQVVLENEQKNQNLKNTTISQINHYNKNLNKCLVEIKHTTQNGSRIAIKTELKDAYEQKTFITCISKLDPSLEALAEKYGSILLPDYCFIPSDGLNNNKAGQITGEQGDAQIKEYMNN